jgi:dTDP-4-dehydrorhamnose reductase
MDKNKPTILGTGLSGMIGSRLVEMFVQKFNFVNLDLATGVDITNFESVNQVLSKHKSTTVIHFAAFTDVSKAYEEKNNKEGMVYRVNVLGTRNIVQACQKYKHYLIHISTDFVFDGIKPPIGGYTEIDEPRPIEWYGQTKLWAEEEVIKSGCQSVIARLAFPFRAKFELKPDLVRNILEKLKNNTLHPMFNDQIITPTFVDDICGALRIFIDKKPTGIYHVVGSTSLTPYDLALKIALIFNLKVDIQSSSFKEFLKTDPRPRQQFSRMSNLKLKQDLGVEMKDIDEALVILKDQLAVK